MGGFLGSSAEWWRTENIYTGSDIIYLGKQEISKKEGGMRKMTSTEQQFREEELGWRVLKQDVDWYFMKTAMRSFEKAESLMKRLRAYVDKQIANIEKERVKQQYEVDCIFCGSQDIEWLERVHHCEGCDVWSLVCHNCGREWLDLLWKSK